MATFVLAIPDDLLTEARAAAKGVTFGDVVTRFAGSALTHMGAMGDYTPPPEQRAEAMAYWLSLGSSLGLISREQKNGQLPIPAKAAHSKAKRRPKNNVVALSDFRAARGGARQ